MHFIFGAAIQLKNPIPNGSPLFKWEGVDRKKHVAVDISRELDDAHKYDITALAEPKIRPDSDTIIRLGLHNFGARFFVMDMEIKS